VGVATLDAEGEADRELELLVLGGSEVVERSGVLVLFRVVLVLVLVEEDFGLAVVVVVGLGSSLP